MTTSVRMTVDDLLQLQRRERNDRYELVHGELKEMTRPNFEHGGLAVTIATELQVFVRSQKLGYVGSETGFKLDEDTVVGPDVAFVRQDRIPNPGPKVFFAGPPDLAVEIISPSDTLKEVAAKAADYLHYGTRLVWVINPRNRTATVYRAEREPRVVSEGGSLDGEDVLPGFSLALADLFAR